MVVVPSLTASELANYHMEISEQPAWRRTSDICADYYDGNQLDADTLHAMEELGMAPIIENLIAPTIDAVLGQEAKDRRDWRVTPQGDDSLKDMSEAINQRLNEAERECHADRACSDAYASMIKAGIGWVGVGREHDPFKYPYLAEAVHRNEMFWDWKSRLPDLSDARYLIRKRWYDVDQLMLAFEDKKELIAGAGAGWVGADFDLLMSDGGQSTGLARDFVAERSGTMQEQEWREVFRKRLCLSEVWYRRWVRGEIIKAPDGRVVEYDKSNPRHVEAVQSGYVTPRNAMYSKVRLSWWIGPHRLADIENPYKHGKIPYVPFFGKREDLTSIPYGLVRPMISLQDEINARNTKMVWLLTAKRVTMTEGITDEDEVRREAGRPDALHVLSQKAMGLPGAVFKVETDFALNQQQYQALGDKREALKNVAGIHKAFEGQNSNATSGYALNTLVEQSAQSLAEINDNKTFARAAVGDLLMSMIIEDIGNEETEVSISREFASEPKVVRLNARDVIDGQEMMNNDVQRARLKVSLADVPSTSSYRQQRLMLLSELTKSLPPDLQAQLLEFVIAATDVPEKEAVIERIREVTGRGKDGGGTGEDPEKQQMAQQIQQLTQALQEAQNAPALKELDAKIELLLAQAAEKRAKAYQTVEEIEAAERLERSMGIQLEDDMIEQEVERRVFERMPPPAPPPQELLAPQRYGE